MVETLSSGTILSGHPILGWIKTFRRGYGNCRLRVVFYHFDGLANNLLISF